MLKDVSRSCAHSIDSPVAQPFANRECACDGAMATECFSRAADLVYGPPGHVCGVGLVRGCCMLNFPCLEGGLNDEPCGRNHDGLGGNRGAERPSPALPSPTATIVDDCCGAGSSGSGSHGGGGSAISGETTAAQAKAEAATGPPATTEQRMAICMPDLAVSSSAPSAGNLDERHTLMICVFRAWELGGGSSAGKDVRTCDGMATKVQPWTPGCSCAVACLTCQAVCEGALLWLRDHPMGWGVYDAFACWLCDAAGAAAAAGTKNECHALSCLALLFVCTNAMEGRRGTMWRQSSRIAMSMVDLLCHPLVSVANAAGLVLHRVLQLDPLCAVAIITLPGLAAVSSWLLHAATCDRAGTLPVVSFALQVVDTVVSSPFIRADIVALCTDTVVGGLHLAVERAARRGLFDESALCGKVAYAVANRLVGRPVFGGSRPGTAYLTMSTPAGVDIQSLVWLLVKVMDQSTSVTSPHVTHSVAAMWCRVFASDGPLKVVTANAVVTNTPFYVNALVRVVLTNLTSEDAGETVGKSMDILASLCECHLPLAMELVAVCPPLVMHLHRLADPSKYGLPLPEFRVGAAAMNLRTQLQRGYPSGSVAARTAVLLAALPRAPPDTHHGPQPCGLCYLSRACGGGQADPRCEELLLPCMHRFHRVCLDGWFKETTNAPCPTCALSVFDHVAPPVSV